MMRVVIRNPRNHEKDEDRLVAAEAQGMDQPLRQPLAKQARAQWQAEGQREVMHDHEQDGETAQAIDAEVAM
jgi:hypothetical protein